MENHNLTAIIPNRTQSMKVKPKNKENKPFGKVNFTYKAEEDTYICPNNKILPFQKNTSLMAQLKNYITQQNANTVTIKQNVQDTTNTKQ